MGVTSAPRCPQNLTCEFRLQIGEPDVIGPKLRADYDRVRALVVSAIDDEQLRAAGRPHFPEGDFLLSLHWRPILPRIRTSVNHQMPTVSDLGGVRERLGHSKGVTTAAVARDHRNLRLPREPSLRSSWLSVG
jgi:hypothetical protein